MVPFFNGGPTGATGATGAAGATGATGPAGNGITVTYKTADESLNSSTVLQADNHLTTSLNASSKYAFRFVIQYTGEAAAGIKVALNGTVTVTNLSSIVLIYDSAPVLSAATPLSVLGSGIGSSGNDGSGVVVIEGSIETNAAGTFLLEWAQNTSDVADTIVKRGSYLQVIPIV